MPRVHTFSKVYHYFPLIVPNTFPIDYAKILYFFKSCTLFPITFPIDFPSVFITKNLLRFILPKYHS